VVVLVSMRTLVHLLSLFSFGRRDVTDPILENLAFRQQLAVLKRPVKRPRLRRRHRAFWVLLSRVWSNWRPVLTIVKPDTVVRWHRRGFRLYWRRKSRRRGPGRPPVSPEIRALIRRMAEADPVWGAPHIHGELLKLGIDISERTVSNLMQPATHQPPSQTWMTFLRNHMDSMAAVDFFTVVTATFSIRYVFVVLSHDRRRVLHPNVTAHPSAEWTARQIVQAFPWDTAPRYLLRDRDSIYGDVFRQWVQGMGVREVLISRQSPWQNPFVERLVGSLRRECPDHVIILGEDHLRRVLRECVTYYHQDRTHYSLGKDPPFQRPVEPKPSATARLAALPRIGGLHRRCQWRDAAQPSGVRLTGTCFA
jgi:putative transposase